jgi:hypothetical protein
MAHSKLFELSLHPFKTADEHLSYEDILLEEFPSKSEVDYFGDSDSSRSEDIAWLKSTLPFAEIITEHSSDVLIVDEHFRKTLHSLLYEQMRQAHNYMEVELKKEETTPLSIQLVSNTMMHLSTVLFYREYVQTDLQLLGWLSIFPDVERFYIGGIIDFHY